VFKFGDKILVLRSNRNSLGEHSMIMKSLPEIFWKRLSDPRVIFLATSDKKQPKFRPVTLIGFERRLFVHSYKETAKIKQIKENPRVEFCLSMGESAPLDKKYARVRCSAEVSDALKKSRQSSWNRLTSSNATIKALMIQTIS
jgi:general stress protein 26